MNMFLIFSLASNNGTLCTCAVTIKPVCSLLIHLNESLLFRSRYSSLLVRAENNLLLSICKTADKRAKKRLFLQHPLEDTECNSSPPSDNPVTSRLSFAPCRSSRSCRRPSRTRWTASWGTSRTVKRTTAPNAEHGPARQGCTPPACGHLQRPTFA